MSTWSPESDPVEDLEAFATSTEEQTMGINTTKHVLIADILRNTDATPERLVHYLDLWLGHHFKLILRERKAALRECGRLGDKLHTTKLEIEVMRARIKELERKQAHSWVEDDNVGSGHDNED